MNMFVRSAPLLLAIAMAGCALPEPVDPAQDFSITAPRRTDAAAEADAAIHTDLIRGMLQQGQYYAAIAHIQDQGRRVGRTEELRYLEAEARRQLGETAAAEKLYRGLLSGRFDAEAYHGLGLLYAGRDLDQAVLHLREAVQRRPTDLESRNDLGYALMMAGRYREALPELATAVELDAGGEKARNNLLILLMLTGDEAGLKRMASQAQVTPQTLARLRKQAQSLKTRGAASRGAK